MISAELGSDYYYCINSQQRKAIGFGVTVAFYLGNFKLRRVGSYASMHCYEMLMCYLCSFFWLKEAAFEELVLLYTEKSDQVDAEPQSQLGSLQLKIYERIPIPDLPVKNLDVFNFLFSLGAHQGLLFIINHFNLHKCRLFFLTRSYHSVSSTRYK